MDNLDAEVAKIYAASDAAAESPAEAVAEDTTEATAEAPADVAADEVEVAEDDSADDTEDADAESDESAADDEETEEPVGHDDELSVLLEDIPSPETINAEYYRIPLTAREKMISLADGWRADRTLIEEIGGRDTAEMLKPVAEMLHKSERNGEDLSSALGSMASLNPLATAELLVKGAADVLFNTDDSPAMRDAAQAGDAVLEARFGEGYTAEHIEKLAMLERGGYIDVDNDTKLLQDEGEASPLFERQQATIAEQKIQIEQLKNLVANPDQIVQATDAEAAAVKRVDDELDKRLIDGIEVFREKVRWGKDSTLMSLTNEALISRLKRDPDYKEAVALAKQSGAIGEKLPHTIERKLTLLANKGKARFVEVATAVSKDLAGIAKTSQNAKLQAKESPQVKAQPVTLSNTPVSTFGGTISLDDRLAKIYGETDAKLRAAGR